MQPQKSCFVRFLLCFEQKNQTKQAKDLIDFKISFQSLKVLKHILFDILTIGNISISSKAFYKLLHDLDMRCICFEKADSR